MWRVSIDELGREPLHGSGAGTFPLNWTRHRRTTENSTEGHSVYLETLGELGVPGGALLLVVLGGVVWALFAGVRRERDGPLYAGLSAAALAWLVHAGLDWDWEMPVLTMWLFAAGGLALAARRAPVSNVRSATASSRGTHRHSAIGAAAAAGCLVLALTPAAVALSQQRLDGSARAFARGDCIDAAELASSSASVLLARPEGYAIRAFCAQRAGAGSDALALMRAAEKRDPDNWKYHYGMALLLAFQGREPIAEARRALTLNPLESATQGAALYLTHTSDPAVLRKRAAELPLPSP
jgi:hypothetical protein